MLTFEVTEEQSKKITKWLKEEVYPKVIAEQKKNIKKPSLIEQDCWEMGYPYTGAIGGGLTYCFSPTSIGYVLVVKYGKYELNVTDYKNW